MKTPHTSTWTGKRVLVKLKNGLQFVDKFIERKGRVVIFQVQGKISAGQIKSFTIYRQTTPTNHNQQLCKKEYEYLAKELLKKSD